MIIQQKYGTTTIPDINQLTKVWEGVLPSGTLTVENLPFRPQCMIEFHGISSNVTFKNVTAGLYDVIADEMVYEVSSGTYSNFVITDTTFSVDITGQAPTNSCEIFIA